MLQAYTLYKPCSQIYSLCPQQSSHIYNAGVIQVSELHTPNVIVLQYSQVLKSHNKSSLADFSIIVHYEIF
jgi:hypothetical protein